MKYKTIFIVSLVVVGLCAVLFLPVTRDALFAAARWAEATPELAWSLYLITFGLAVVLMIPAWFFMMAGGYLFGSLLGTLLSFSGYLLGSTAAFLLARTVAHDEVQRRIAHMPRFQVFVSVVEQGGFVAVLLARLALVFPYNLLNIACGLTSISLRDYLLGTALGILPVLLVNVFLGATTTDLLVALEEGTLQSPQDSPWAVVAMVGIVIIVALLLRHIGVGVLKKRLDTNSD